MPFLGIAAGSSILGGVGNYMATSAANSDAQNLQQQQLQKWIQLNIPDPEQQKLALQQYQVAGTLTPALQAAIKQDPSGFNQITANQTDAAAQNKALDSLQQIGDQGGLRLQDKAAIQDAFLNTQAQARANAQNIAAQQAQRGLGGSGFEVAAQLSNQQGAANQNAKNSLDVAGQAQDRALQAIMNSGNLATQYQNQNYQQQNAKASAQDAINQFNTKNSQDVSNNNVNSQNAAQQYNLQNKQDISNKNTDQSNYQQQYNKSLAQQQYENKIKQLQGEQGGVNNESSLIAQQGQNTGNLFSNFGNAASGAASSAGNQNYWDNYFKKKASSS